MLKRKCPGCGRKVSGKFNFCPFCGYSIKKNKERKNYGMLGRNDGDLSNFESNLPFGMNKLFNSLIQKLDKEMGIAKRRFDKESSKKKKIKTKGLSINISTGEGEKPKIKIRGLNPNFKKIKKKKKKSKGKIKKSNLSEKDESKLAKLPREEAKTQVRRFSDRLVYEIQLPGVKNIEDVAINQLEDSIEIKALSQDKIYFKFLPVKLPISDYSLNKGKLNIELNAND